MLVYIHICILDTRTSRCSSEAPGLLHAASAAGRSPSRSASGWDPPRATSECLGTLGILRIRRTPEGPEPGPLCRRRCEDLTEPIAGPPVLGAAILMALARPS